MEERKQALQSKKMCRFCFNKQDSQLSSIYQKEPKTVPLPIQIMSCMSIEVFPNDGFPQLICGDCKQQTHQSYIFKSNCRKAEDALKNYLLTGELNKPEFQGIVNRKRPAENDKPTESTDKFVNNEDQNMDVKKTKLDDGTEVITLCISNNSEQDEEEASEVHKEVNSEGNMDLEISQDGQTNLFGNVTEKIVETDVFACDQCHKTFALEQMLELHITNYHRERNFSCTQCDSKFFNKYDLAKHINTHNTAKPFACVVCDKRFNRLNLLKRHESVHNDAPRYMCMSCEKTFLTTEELNEHSKTHSKNRPFVCELCKKAFVFKQGLVRHMTLQHSTDMPHKCNYCSESFMSPINLTRHLVTHAGYRPYPCKVCSRTFLLSHHLSRHMKTHFSNEEGGKEAIFQYKCDMCSMSFKKKDSLVNHSAIHSMVNLKCVICNTSFESAQRVKDHITTHLQGLNFSCEKCEYSFDTQQQLTEHEVKHAEMEYEEQIEQEIIHNSDAQNNKSLLCGICSTFFQNVKTLKEHIKTHFEKLPFPCDKCSYSFETEDQLMEHGAKHIEDDDVEDQGEDVTHFSITDFSDPTQLIPSSKQETSEYSEFNMDDCELSNQEEAKEVEEINAFDNYPKSDLSTQDSREMLYMSDIAEQTDSSSQGIKPIHRVEGTKMYKRKGPINRKIPEISTQLQEPPPQPLEDNVNACTLSTDVLTNMSEEPPVSMKVGDRTVKVQKFIISKDEMKHMAKMGILEVKNGKVIMKTPGKSILNAKIKPVQQSDIENLIFGQKPNKTQQVRQYERKSHHEDKLDNSKFSS